MRVVRRFLVLFALGALLLGAAHAPQPVPTCTEAAPGVFVFRTAPYGDVGLDGNSVAIVSDDGVLVFDANGTPAAARAVLAKLRTLTKQPVRWLVYSHWHWDHWYGAEVYADAYPGLAIVAHEATRTLMAGPAIAFNQPGLDEQLPAHVDAVEQRLAKAKAAHAGAAEVGEWERHAALDRWFLAQKRSVRHVLPTVTFTDSLTIHLGSRTVRVEHVDRAITPGDAFLVLPAEHVLVTGDLLVNPVTFALFCYPDGWIRTLEHLDALDATTIVPGHGAPLRDEALLHATLALLRRERALVRERHAAGAPADSVIAAVLADGEVQRLRASITAGDAAADASFPTYLVAWFVQRAIAEAEAPLDDSIPSLP